MRGKHNNHAKSENCGRWNNNKIISTDGYVKIRVGKTHPLADPNGYCYEHKLVVASAFGIDAIKGKLIHHKKGKTDNRLENLEIQTRSSHNALHNSERGRNKKGQFLRKSETGNELDGVYHKEFPNFE